MQIVAALVWPALALVFAGAFFWLWYVDKARLHLLAFGIGFFALFLAMALLIAFPSMKAPLWVASLHGLSCASVVAIVWGATARLNQRTPLVAMCVIALISCILLFIALNELEHSVALLVQNGSSGILFGIGAVSLWTARSTNILDRILVWTTTFLAGLSLLRPLFILYLHIDIAPLVEREFELNAALVVLLTVLTAVLGLSLIVIAIQEAVEIRHGAQRSDPVSGFLDQRTFEQKSEAALVTASRLSMPVTLAVLQFDWYEKILAKWGPDTSDMVIREIADVVRTWQRDSDVIGRISENRLAIVFVGVGARSVQKTVCKLREDIDDACNERMGGVLKFTVSSSIAQAGPRTVIKSLLRDALTALSRAQGLGANVSFVDGVEINQADLSSPQDGTIVSHG